jgi:hypothetical protein
VQDASLRLKSGCGQDHSLSTNSQNSNLEAGSCNPQVLRLPSAAVHWKVRRSQEEGMTQNQERSLRQHLVDLLGGGGAHAKFEDVIKGLPVKLRGAKPAKFPHSPWMLLEHLRLGQWDILEFSRSSKHVSPDWPSGYWPNTQAPPNAAAWNKSVRQFRRDLGTLQKLVANPKTDLFAQIRWGDGQTILREALLVADHNAYHIAQLVDVRRMLGAWK